MGRGERAAGPPSNAARQGAFGSGGLRSSCTSDTVHARQVIHGVDATSLMANERICDCVSTSAFDAALFLFPHCGMKGRIQKNRGLVEAFFSNVGSVLSTTGRVEVVLASGQGGTPLDGEATLIYGNTWMVALAAAEGGFVLSAAEPFDFAGWAALGYTSRGCWRGLGDSMQKGFRTGGAICHEFVREARGVASPFPLGWQMDASFWAPSHWRQQLQLAAVPSAERPLLGHCEAGWRHRGNHRPEPAADEPLECLRRAAAALLQERGVEVLDAQAVDVFEAPDGRLSACIRFTYVAARSALTRAGMVAAHTLVREGMGGAVPGVSLRTRLDDSG